jgi:MFS family permease
MGTGSVVGALVAGARGRVSPRLLVGAAAVFGVMELLAAAAPVLPLQMAALALLGAATITFSSGVNSALQLAVAPAMRGRVMALYSIVFVGTTPIGAPFVGWIADVLDPRAGLAIGAVAALLTAACATVLFRRAGTWAALPAPPASHPSRARRLGGSALPRSRRRSAGTHTSAGSSGASRPRDGVRTP